MIEINQLQKNFGEKKAVDIEKYSIYQGDMLGLVGNNGAGKTTPVSYTHLDVYKRQHQCRFPANLPWYGSRYR